MIKFILLFILTIFLFALFVGLGFILKLVRLLKKQTNPRSQQNSRAYGNNSSEQTKKEEEQASQQKIFKKDEGEYVDYEDVK
ncbi:MAG: hypothetical protein RL662_2088 [Bacteroidota bacterium]|jgi:predicted Holliday junction resolvase-like endonuclease